MVDVPLVPPRRSRRRLAAAIVVCALFLSWLVGCTSTITPPRDPLEPVSVIVLAEAMHRGVLLPNEAGGYVEYGFGDWEWFANGNDAWYRAFPTVLWPTAGALGRREHPGRDVLEIKAQMPGVRLQELKASGPKVRALRDRLERDFTSRAAAGIWQPLYRMRFVPQDDGYWWAFNCTDQVAVWLRELDCEVSWVLVRLELEVE